ncbi:tRNA threonylcarbamoyladenosine biosynthesis protein TsaB [Pacificibacter maritimus]|uniref:tRNA threonylcarbamoyladenosine biosynthesis protein TsaB n=1 Tax=Pacificibacter maritimus TaxID=762213 RepID=A0A3N4VGN3_9RHOB|nr:hypothetical protein [Pacificibacter maritimus]RPE72094.1 tRNA threonylcarbamoyladenosine biosynthesis protein TsaB [Pacificibacter maritimus]
MTELTFLLQTSNGVPVMGLAQGDIVVFDSAQDETLRGSRDYRTTLETALDRLGAKLENITELYVDIGPGGLGVTRTGVAFANALGFALGRPTVGLPAFELLGHQLEQNGSGPVAILRKAARPFVHFGLFADGKLSHYEHCERDTAVEQLAKLDSYALAGNVDISQDIMPTCNVAAIETMLKIARKQPAAAPNTRAYPIVETLA